MRVEATVEALADPTRFGVVTCLRAGPQRAGALAEALGARPNALTRHLRVLREAGVVEEVVDPSDGRARVYRLRVEPFQELGAWADELTGHWEAQLEGFAAHVAQRVAADRG